jgi:uncharacterized NAD(P)/FAD-binding protein YdhS
MASGWVSAIDGEAYLPRKCYGDYLAELLQDTLRRYKQHSVEIIIDEVVEVRSKAASHIDIVSAAGDEWRTDACVLALGTSTPPDPLRWSLDDFVSERFFRDPWTPNIVPTLVQSDTCVLIGSGLTTLDVVTALDDHGYRGSIHIVSRSGLLPLAHTACHTPPQCNDLETVLKTGSDIRKVFRQVRLMAAHASRNSADWQGVMDILRPHIPSLWQQLGSAQQRRFLRHVRRYWDHHRHRVAPAVRNRFDRLVANGQVQIHHARVGDVQRRHTRRKPLELSLHARAGSIDKLEADYIVNCTGPAFISCDTTQRVVQKLRDAYPSVIDPLGLGLNVDSDMRLCIPKQQAPIFTLGAPLKGQLWECTAVPECRQAVARIVETLAARYGE